MEEIIYEERIGWSPLWLGCLIFGVFVVIFGVAVGGYIIAAMIAFNLSHLYKAAAPLVYRITKTSVVLQRNNEQVAIPFEAIIRVEKPKGILNTQVDGKRVKGYSLGRGFNNVSILFNDLEPKAIYFKPSEVFLNKLREKISVVNV